MEELERIKTILEFAGTILLTVGALIIVFKLNFKKIDKNKNNKIEKEELTGADLQFCCELLKESFKTIALGIYKNGNIGSKKTYNLIFDTLKKSKNLIEETVKKEEEGENKSEKNS